MRRDGGQGTGQGFPARKQPVSGGKAGPSAGARLLVLLLVTFQFSLVLNGCGFRLRGSVGDIESLPPTHVRGDEASPVVNALREVLRSGGVSVVDDAAQAGMIVTVSGVSRDRRVLSVGTTGRVQEYELHYALRFRVDDGGGRPLLADQQVSLVRDFSFDETEVVAKSNEEEELFRGMRQEAVIQVLRRLQAAARQP